ncbi:MAG: glucose 1-dehydrogenase [Sphingomonadaceae bacterium]|nr:glucose 1-dehydrogenase [Sphingomonadaceae bacterium]
MSEKPLLDKVVIVTGASRGIGKGLALAFAEAGADLVLSARTLPDLEQTAREVEAKGRRALVVEMDSYKYDTVQAVITRAVDHFGKLDVLVNNAGGSRNVPDGWKGFLEADHIAVERLMQMHVVSPYAAAKAAAAVMMKQGNGGVIINIDSALAHYPSSNVQNYSAVKRALQEMTKLWALDLGPYGIRVNSIGPGITRSATTEKLFADEEAEAKAALTVPLRRLGEPSDIAGMAVFLCTDAAEWISGATVMISGGQRY